MTRLVALIGLGTLLFFAASCGAHQPVPSVSIEATSFNNPPFPTLTFSFVDPATLSETRVWVYDVRPSGGPSGILALESVHDGRVQTPRWPLRFQDLQVTGKAAVLVNERQIETYFAAGVHGGEPSVVGEKTQGGGLWTTHSLVKAGQEEVFWIMNRYAGPVEDSHEWDVWLAQHSHIDLSDVVALSRQIPSMTSYCLMVSVDKASS